MFPHRLVKTTGFQVKCVINLAADCLKALLLALCSDPIRLPEYQLCLPVSTLAEKEFLGFTVCCHSSGSTDQHGPEHSLLTRTNQEQCLPSSIFIPTTAFAGAGRGGWEAISLSPRLPCESGSYSLSSGFSKPAELLIRCVGLAVAHSEITFLKKCSVDSQQQQQATYSSSCTDTLHKNTEVGFFTVCWPATINYWLFLVFFLIKTLSERAIIYNDNSRYLAESKPRCSLHLEAARPRRLDPSEWGQEHLRLRKTALLK